MQKKIELNARRKKKCKKKNERMKCKRNKKNEMQKMDEMYEEEE